LRGDIYVLISDIEIGLHVFIKDDLVRRFGKGELEWWRHGVPERVRKDCVSVREDDSDPTEPYRYTSFIHLSEIIGSKANWASFQETFKHFRKDKLFQDLRDLNTLRNAVMHPVKQKPWKLEHLEVLKRWHGIVQKLRPDQIAPRIGENSSVSRPLPQDIRQKIDDWLNQHSNAEAREDLQSDAIRERFIVLPGEKNPEESTSQNAADKAAAVLAKYGL